MTTSKEILRNALSEVGYDHRWDSGLAQYEKIIKKLEPLSGNNPFTQPPEIEAKINHLDHRLYHYNIVNASLLAQSLINLFHRPSKKQYVVLTKDTRPGTDLIARSFIESLLKNLNIGVIYAGEGSSAYHAFATNYLSKRYDIAFGVCLTGSHSQWPIIGIEPNYGSTSKNHLAGIFHSAEDLQGTKEEALRLVDLAPNIRPVNYLNFEDQHQKLKKRYFICARHIIKEILGNVSVLKTSPIHLLADTGNNVSVEIIKPLLEKFGIDYSIVNEKLKYVPDRNPDPNDKSIDKLMKEHLAESSYKTLGVAYDTDADRSPFFDFDGKRLPGDWIAALIGYQLSKKGTYFVFPFETNNHFGVPILTKSKLREIVGTVDAGLFLEKLFKGVNFHRSTIGKPFVFQKVSQLVSSPGNYIIPHSDGPLTTILVFGILSKIYQEEDKSLEQSILGSLPSISSYETLRDYYSIEEKIRKQIPLSNQEIKKRLLKGTSEEIRKEGYNPISFDTRTKIIKKKGLFILLRSSGHDNTRLYIEATRKKNNKINLERLIYKIKKIIKEKAIKMKVL